jgi:DNA-binding SARP family transcriptional activator
MTNKKTTKETEKKWKKLDQEEMKEEDHQLELMEGYQQDEAYEESKE